MYLMRVFATVAIKGRCYLANTSLKMLSRNLRSASKYVGTIRTSIPLSDVIFSNETNNEQHEIVVKSNEEDDIDRMSTLLNAAFADEISELTMDNLSQMGVNEIVLCLDRISTFCRAQPHKMARPDLLLLVYDKLLKNARFLELREIIKTVKSLITLKVSSNSLIMQTFLQLIRHHINDFQFREIVFMEQILRKTESTPLIRTLQAAFPVVVRNHLDLEVKSDDPRQLAQMFYYACRHSFGPGECKKIGDVLMNFSEKLTLKEALVVLWGRSYSSKNDSNLTVFCTELLIRDLAQVPEAELVHLVQRLARKNCLSFPLLSAISVEAQKFRIDSLFGVIRTSLSCRYIDLRLLETFSRRLEHCFGIDDRFPFALTEIADVFATANVRPKNIRKLIARMMSSNGGKFARSELPDDLKAKFALNLSILGAPAADVYEFVYDSCNSVASKSDAANLTHSLNLARLKQIFELEGVKHGFPAIDLNLDECLKCNSRADQVKTEGLLLRDAITAAIGTEHVLRNGLFTKSGIYIDHLIVETNNVDKCKNSDVRFVEDFPLIHSERKSLAILVHFSDDCASNAHHTIGNRALSAFLLRKCGINVAEIYWNQWIHFLDKEKILYLKRLMDKNYHSFH